MSILVESAKVMSKGQITLPKDVRERMGVEQGDRVVLVWNGRQVVMMNPAQFALEVLQDQMVGVAKSAGFDSEEDVADYITSLRREARAG